MSNPSPLPAPEGTPLSQRQRIALIVGVSLAGAFIGPFGFFALGTSQVAGRRLDALTPNALGAILKGATTEGPIMVMAGCSLIATLLVAPWFVSSIDRLSLSSLSKKKYYWLAANRGVALGMLATIANTLILLGAATLASAEKLAEPGAPHAVVLFFGVIMFGTIMGVTFSLLAIPVIVPIGGALGAAVAWVRDRLA